MGDALGDALTAVADDVIELPPRELVTDRLFLRRWIRSDVDALGEINADQDVMRHFTAPLTRQQTARQIAGYEAAFAHHGFGPWAVQLVGDGELIGVAGLLPVALEAHFVPAVHLVVKLAGHAWRHGYGTEAAHEVFRDGFERVGLAEIVAFTARRNEPSWRGMASLGMTHDPADDFVYPTLTEGHPLRDQVLYRIRNPRLVRRARG